jgi:hypothetical protein
LAVIVNGDKGFFAKKNILMARGFFFQKKHPGLANGCRSIFLKKTILLSAKSGI